jgi:hypothetical protein
VTYGSAVNQQGQTLTLRLDVYAPTGDAMTDGLQAYLTTFEGAGHVPYTRNRTTILDQTTNFLYWTLDLTHAGR